MFDYQSPITVKFYGSLSNEMIKFSEDTAHAEINATIGYNINKEELIKALTYDRHQYEKGYQDGKAEVKLETGWISVNDRLPPKEDSDYSVNVIITDGKCTSIGYYSYRTGSWVQCYCGVPSSISHWLPIPNLPVEKVIADDTEIQFKCNKCHAKFTQVFAKCGYMDGKAAAICPKCRAISKQLGD